MANDENASGESKISESTTGIVLALIFFFPLGLYWMWKYPNWPTGNKWAVTGGIAILALIGALTDDGKQADPQSEETITSSAPQDNVSNVMSNTTDANDELQKEADKRRKEAIERAKTRPVGIDIIAAEMHKNSLTGRDKYDGKTLTMIGFIHSIDKTTFGTPYVVLVGLTEDYRYLDVAKFTCYLSRSDSKLSELETRSPIELKGTISGLKMSYGRAVADIKDCEIIKVGL